MENSVIQLRFWDIFSNVFISFVEKATLCEQMMNK